jgi:hypothetical protein
MKLTMPQILMMNHGAWVNGKRFDARCERNKTRAEETRKAKEKQDEDDPIVLRGKRLSELNSDEMMEYYR